MSPAGLVNQTACKPTNGKAQKVMHATKKGRVEANI